MDRSETKRGSRGLETIVGATSAIPGAQGVPRFNSAEHQSLGDTATNTARYDIGGATDSFRLTHGDLVALSGDFFLAGPETESAGGRGQPDDLFDLASRPGDGGQSPGTRDELIWALKTVRGDDARFARSGEWGAYVFSEAVQEAVNERYQRLAAANATHFVSPHGRDASGQPKPSSEGSASSSYRRTHEAALRLAYRAGLRGEPIDPGLAMEAAAQHYLTDSFASGHLRTPVASMRDDWGRKYPLFWYNLRHKIALDTAIRLNDQTTNPTTVFGTVNQMYVAISQQVETIAASLPAITLGDLLSKVFHDVDNAAGLDVVGGGRMYGDDRLDDPDPNNRTRASAQRAIGDGIADVQTAYRLGGQTGGAPLPDAELFAQVRAATSTGDRYLAETRMPVPVATSVAQNWMAASLEALWDLPATGTSGPSVGTRISEAFQPGTELRNMLDDLAAEFPEIDSHASGDLHPRRAYLDGFLAPLVANPREGIVHILHWAPNYGLADSSRDDQCLASGLELDAANQLGGMTTIARVAYVNELIDGVTTGSEGPLVVRLFETAPASERRVMYRQIEGHDWNGDFRHGVFVSDDRLWNALSRGQLDQLRVLIQG